MVRTDSGAQYSGQPVHANIDTLYLFPATDFPVGPDWYSKVQRVPFSDIDHVLLQRGGNRFTRARRSVSLVVPRTDKLYTSPFQSIRVASVYSDSLGQAKDLKEAFVHSKVLRQVFPKKHLRISFGLGFGGNNALFDAENALRNSPLPNPYYYQDRLSLGFLDISGRFGDRYIVGGQLAARNLSYTLSGNSNAPDSYSNYNNNIYYSERRLYAEYVFFPVDRFFTHRYELLAGAGFLMGKPEWFMRYYFDDYVDPDNWITGEETHEQKDNLFGLQLRSAFHFLLQEHTLSFSDVRLKFGVSIYL